MCINPNLNTNLPKYTEPFSVHNLYILQISRIFIYIFELSR